MALFGWESARQATVYTASADRKRLAAEAVHLMGSDHSENTDCPTEASHRKILLYLNMLASRWWAVTDSNRRHPACKAGALPTELTALGGRFSKIR
jgi:hypothetical protein